MTYTTNYPKFNQSWDRFVDRVTKHHEKTNYIWIIALGVLVFLTNTNLPSSFRAVTGVLLNFLLVVVVVVPVSFLIVDLAIITPTKAIIRRVRGRKSKRLNKTNLHPERAYFIIDSLRRLGVEDAANVVWNSPANAEAYERVFNKAMRLSSSHKMRYKEARHHSHWLGTIVYPGAIGLAREAALTRLLDDRGIMSAEDAMALLEGQQAMQED